MIKRHLSKSLLKAADSYPVVTLTGARQSGKTTLVRALFPDHTYVTLESPDARSQALADPRTFLARDTHLILDEVQRAPDLLSYIQELVDEDQTHGRFIVTGSHNLLLMKSVAQTLAGRTAVLALSPFSVAELSARSVIDPFTLDTVTLNAGHTPPRGLWETLFTGFYPYIHDRGADSQEWYADYFRTYVERDLREIIEVNDLPRFETFVRLAASHTGRELNYSTLASDIGVTQQTARRYLRALELGYLVRTLPPHTANFRKRVRSRSRLHFMDSGLVCYLLGIRDAEMLERHPLRGHIFESYVVSELIKHGSSLRRDQSLYCWRDATGHEIDIVIDAGSTFIPVEVKSGSTVASDAFKTLEWWMQLPDNPAMRAVLVHGGDACFDVRNTRVLPWFLA